MKTLAISGSIRSRHSAEEWLLKIVRESAGIADYKRKIAAFQAENGALSNCDILSGATLLSALETGSEVDFFSLRNLFPRRDESISLSKEKEIDFDLAATDTLSIEEDKFEDMKQRVSEAGGIILVTPVYFGDRSSVANKFLQLSGIHDLISGKVFGAVSVGAKRNGGQETSIIYSLIEALNQRASVVGNGPPTSQYGGTAVAGKKGTVLDDDWGLETALGTGRRVAHVGELIGKGTGAELDRPLRITVFVTMDDINHQLQGFLEDYLSKAGEKLPNVEFRLENILDSTIYRCLGCDNCPSDGKLPIDEQATPENHKHCIIKDKEDHMERIQNIFLESDGIMIAGLNVKKHDHLIYRYQALVERTRYIRRDNFELTNKVFTAFTLNQVGASINSLHSMKTITSYIRHNMIVSRPVVVNVFEGKTLNDGMDAMEDFVAATKAAAAGKGKVKKITTEYIAKDIGGY